MPSGGNPQALRHVYRIKLRLGEFHPILVCHRSHGVSLFYRPHVVWQQGHGSIDIGIGIKHGNDETLFPNFGAGLVRLIKNRLFFVCACVSVFDGGGQSAHFHQFVRQQFGMTGRHDDVYLQKRHAYAPLGWCSSIQCSR